MSIRVSCPFCNTSAVLPARPPAGRAACPRCGEMFPVKDAEEVVEAPVEATQPGADAPRAPFPSTKALLLSCALAAVILGVGVYLYRPFGPSPAPAPPDNRPPGTTPPAALAGLRHLPPGANVVFAVQPGPLLAYAERTGTDPKAVLAAAGVPAEVPATLDRVGLPLDQIDHLAGGVTLAANDLFPGLALVLKLRRPVPDEDRFLQNLRAEKKPRAGRPTYAVTAGLPLTMTKLDDRTYLFGLRDADLSAADAPTPPPAWAGDALAKLSPASFVWVATADDRWADKAAVKAFAQGKAKERAAEAALLRQIVAGVSLEPDPRLRVIVRTADATTGQRLREYFAGKLATEKAAVAGEAEWAEADVPFDPAAAGGVVRKLLPQ